MQKELFYVAASRGRESVLVITSDKERLRESIAQSTARKSASELARQQRPGLRQGMHRGRAMARELIQRAVQVLQPLKNKPKVERSHDHGISR